MTRELDTAVRLCELAECALSDVEIETAIASADRARKLLAPCASVLEGGVFVRASTAQVDALALSDDLKRAKVVAATAVRWSSHCQVEGRFAALARLKLLEVEEMRRRYVDAAKGFEWLERCLPAEQWAAPLTMRCANHMLSIGVHNADRFIAERGVACGARVRSMVTDVDEVSAWLQWRGLHESRRHQHDAAAQTFAESFELRATTARRDITRRFIEAEMAFFEDDAAGVAMLSEAVELARQAGLVRHARAASRHMSRYFV